MAAGGEGSTSPEPIAAPSPTVAMAASPRMPIPSACLPGFDMVNIDRPLTALLEV